MRSLGALPVLMLAAALSSTPALAGRDADADALWERPWPRALQGQAERLAAMAAPTGGGQDQPKVDHSTMDHSTMDHSAMEHTGIGEAQVDYSTMDHTMEHSGMDHGAMGHDAHGTRADTAPPLPAITDADRRAAFPVLGSGHATHDDRVHHYLLFDRLEASDADHGSTPLSWEVEGWLGTDIDRLWLRSEGERSGGETHSADLELLYGRSVSAWWDVVAGVRHEFLPADGRSWVAVGVQGLAPQMFEVQATAYIGEGGRTRASAEVEYELLLTNRLVLQPVVEASWHGDADAARGIGAGLSMMEAGLRLRYEVTRRFAPYIGVVHERAFGDTADLRRAAGGDDRDTRVVAGIRAWF